MRFSIRSENPKAVVRKKIRHHEKGFKVTEVGLLRRGAKDIARAGFWSVWVASPLKVKSL